MQTGNVTAIGYQANVDGKSNNSTVIGANTSSKDGYNNVIIGANSSAEGHHDCVIIGSGLKATRDYQILIGNAKIVIDGRDVVLKTNQVKNVKPASP